MLWLTRNSIRHLANKRHSNDITSCTDPLSIGSCHVDTSPITSINLRVSWGKVGEVRRGSRSIVVVAVGSVGGEAEDAEPHGLDSGVRSSSGDGTVVLERVMIQAPGTPGPLTMEFLMFTKVPPSKVQSVSASRCFRLFGKILMHRLFTKVKPLPHRIAVSVEKMKKEASRRQEVSRLRIVIS